MDTQEIRKHFSKMNDMQQKAVFHTEGPLLILAGAGSGKTTVLVNRIAYILQCGLCEPWQILAITFTNKAATELKERICKSVPEGGADIWAATFHSTCARILRRFGDRIGYGSHFTIYDTDDQRRLMKDILKELNVDEKMLPHRKVLGAISSAKDEMKSPEQMKAESSFDVRQQTIAKAYGIYQKKLKDANAMDFDDMLLNTVLLFEEHKDVLELYQRQFKYIMVDEYQDTNRVQYRFVSLLAGGSNNICVVGDDDQSIYKFRGATIENILSFEDTFKSSSVIRLEQNYRSTKNILAAANDVIQNNKQRKGKTLWTQNEEGDKITLHTAYDEREEARFVADTILDEVAKGANFSDFAILYRMNAQSNAVEQALARAGVPHRIIGGHRFYDREEIKDMTAYLQVINNPDDSLRLSRIINKPKRGIGDTTVGRALDIGAGIGESLYEVIGHASDFPELSRSASKLMAFHNLIAGFIEAANDDDTSLGELYNLILEHTDYKNYLKAEKENADERIENIDELLSNINTFEHEYGDEANLSAFLEEISLQTDIDNYDAEADCATMMTLHSSKGLEFPTVFLIGMEEGIFPSMAALMSGEELDEEHRLAYVGITRAKKKLYLTCTRSRMLFGSTQHNKVSRFAEEISEQYLERTGVTKAFGSAESLSSSPSKIGIGTAAKTAYNPYGIKKPAGNTTAAAGNSYKVGDRVKHKVFGVGMVIKAEPMGKDTMMEISFESVGTKTLMANFSKMEKL